MYVAHMFSPHQLRAARSLIQWSREQLAKAAGVSAVSIKTFELGSSDPRLSTLTALRAALAKEGVIFLEANADHGPGVAFKASADGTRKQSKSK